MTFALMIGFPSRGSFYRTRDKNITFWLRCLLFLFSARERENQGKQKN
jgi:hypothetical protein